MKKLIFPLLAIFLAIDSVIFFAQHNSTNYVAASGSNPGYTTDATTDNATAQPTNTQNVTISNFAFSPQTVTVLSGTTVTWTNQDTVPHTVTANNGSFDSGDIPTNSSYSLMFNTAGTYDYHCSHHPEMTGTIVVSTAAPNNQPTNNDNVATAPSTNNTNIPTDTAPITTNQTPSVTTTQHPVTPAQTVVTPTGTTPLSGASSSQSQNQSQSQSAQPPAGTTAGGYTVTQNQSQSQSQSISGF